MAYRVDDGIDTWPESMRAGTAALGLYLRCGAWICRELTAGRITDAVVPAEVATMYGSKEWIARLLDVGLWMHVEDGYADCRYFDLNPTPEKVAVAREAKKKRQERWLEKARRANDGIRDASQDGSTDIAPPPPKKRGGGRAPATRGAARAPADAQPRCPNHLGQPAHNCGPCASERKGAA